MESYCSAESCKTQVPIRCEKCILHSKNENKELDIFNSELTKRVESKDYNFDGIIFPKDFRFERVVWEEDVSFKESVFKGVADFSGCEFRNKAIFEGAAFREGALFSEADFLGYTSFSKSEFDERSNFEYASFYEHANFTYSVFHGVRFSGAGFRVVDFGRATFNGPTFFTEGTLSNMQVDLENDGESGQSGAIDRVQFESANFWNCNFHGDALFVGQGKEKRIFADGISALRKIDIAPDATVRISYADLSQCLLAGSDLRRTELTDIKWCEGVSSDGLLLEEFFSRTGIYDESIRRVEGEFSDVDLAFVPLSDPPLLEIEKAYRQLKKNYEEHGDFPKGGDFHIGEKVARRKRAWKNFWSDWGQWTLLSLYRALSKYGERALPAALWLAVLIFGFALLYYLSGATTLATVGAVTYPEAFLHSLEATFYPVRSVGFLTFWPQLFSIVQRVISPVLIALLALALRQRVKR